MKDITDLIVERMNNLESRLMEAEAKLRGHWTPQIPIYFRDGQERYLRREILDEFISGKQVDMDELRQAMGAFVNHYCEQSDGVAMMEKELKALRQRLSERQRLPERPRPYHPGYRPPRA